jgi:hypothetical protein
MKIGGLRVDALKYSPETLKKLRPIIEEMRKVFVIPSGVDAIKDTRFNSNPHVIWLLESAVPEAELEGQRHEVVFAALLEAARSDHWYKYEKDWGDKVYDYEEECGPDYEVEE